MEKFKSESEDSDISEKSLVMKQIQNNDEDNEYVNLDDNYFNEISNNKKFPVKTDFYGSFNLER